jgi:hypothetical protein
MKVLFLASSALVVASVSAACDYHVGSTREQCISSGCYWFEPPTTGVAPCQGMPLCVLAAGNETLCEGMAWESEYSQGRLNCTWSVTASGTSCAWDGPVAPTPAPVTPPPTVATCKTQRSQQDCANFDSACAWLTIQSSTFGGCYDSRTDSIFLELACGLDGKHPTNSNLCANVEMHDQAGVHVCKYNAQIGCTCGADRQQPPQHGCTW